MSQSAVWCWLFCSIVLSLGIDVSASIADESPSRAILGTAYVPLRKRVQELLARFTFGMDLQDFAAKFAKIGEPSAQIGGKRGVDLTTQALRYSRAFTSGGNGDLQIAAADNRSEVKIAVGWIVDRIAEDIAGLGVAVDGGVDVAVAGRRDDEETIREVAGLIIAQCEADASPGSQLMHFVTSFDCDDLHISFRIEQ